MLQAIRNNSQNASFYIEYFRFEVKFFEKVKQRIMILNGDQDKKIDFITEQEDGAENEEVDNSGRLSGSTKLIEIVFENIKELFGQKLAVVKACHHIAKESALLPQEVKDSVKEYYHGLKFSDKGIKQYFSSKLKAFEDVSLIKVFLASKLATLDKVDTEMKQETINMIKE